MPFWTKERLESEQAKQELVAPYRSDHIEQCAYALGVAAEYAITAEEDGGGRRRAKDGEHITIPPGQFALLLTEEVISVPSNALAFISVKAKLKLRGLVNVSGFHVDPGFRGRLKFAVYNTGSLAIDLKPGQRMFLVWYCDLDQTTSALYSGAHQGQDSITPDDVMSIRGMVVSPAGLSLRVDEIENDVKAELRRLESKIDTHQNWSRPILVGVAMGLLFIAISALAKPLIEHWSSPAPASPRAPPAHTSLREPHP